MSKGLVLAVVAAGFAWSGCSSMRRVPPPPPAPAPMAMPAPPLPAPIVELRTDEVHFETVAARAARRTPVKHQKFKQTIYFATSRARTGSGKAETFYGEGNANGLQLGTCTVTIPPNHVPGKIERPNLTEYWIGLDPQKHMILREVRPLSRPTYFQSLRTAAARAEGGQVLVYVHGFNNSFTDAALRTAQLYHDLEFQGAPVFFSWPARKRPVPTPVHYERDRREAEAAARHLRRFLEMLAAESGASSIHLVVHSMGNYLVQLALNGTEGRAPAAVRSKLNQVVLAAADLDAGSMRRLAQVLRHPPDVKVPHVTIYSSSADRALLASKTWNRVPPIGLAGPPWPAVDGVDVVDISCLVSDMLGHATYADNRLSLFDLKELIFEGIAAGSRRSVRLGETGDHFVYVCPP